MKKVKTLILGATVLAAGIAAVLQDCLIADNGIIAGAEYANALHGAGASLSIPKTAEGARLARELYTIGIAEEGKPVHLPGLQPVVAKILIDSGARVLFTARLTALRQMNGIFEVEFYTTGGFLGLQAEKVVDTTSGTAAHLLGIDVKAASMELACILVSDDIHSALPVIPGARVAAGRYPGVCTAHFPANDLTQAQEDIAGRIKELRPWKLGTIAYMLDCTPAVSFMQADGFTYLPSAFSADPLSAFERGVLFAKGAACDTI